LSLLYNKYTYFVFQSKSLSHILRILEHKRLNCPVVNLSEVLAGWGVQIKYQWSSKQTLSGSQAASHLFFLTTYYLLGKIFHKWWILELGFSHWLQQVFDMRLVNLFVEFDGHRCLLGVHEDVHDLGASYSFSLFKKLATVHFVKKNITRKNYLLLRVSCSRGNDIVAVYYILDCVVVDLGEPVSNLYAVLVPTGLFFLSLDWQVYSARLLVNNIFHVFENYMFDGSVVDLSVIQALWRVQVQNNRSSKIIVVLK